MHMCMYVLGVPQSMLDAQGAEARRNLCVCMHIYTHVCVYTDTQMCTALLTIGRWHKVTHEHTCTFVYHRNPKKNRRRGSM